MENLQRDGPDSGTPFEPPTAAERRAVRSERVVLTVCAPVLDGRHAGDEWAGYGGPDADPELTDEDAAAASGRSEPELPWSSLLGQPRNIVILAGGLAAAAVVWLLSGDAGNAFWSGLVDRVPRGVAGRRLAVPFSFGAGVRRVPAGSGAGRRGSRRTTTCTGTGGQAAARTRAPDRNIDGSRRQPPRLTRRADGSTILGRCAEAACTGARYRSS